MPSAAPPGAMPPSYHHPAAYPPPPGPHHIAYPPPPAPSSAGQQMGRSPSLSMNHPPHPGMGYAPSGGYFDRDGRGDPRNGDPRLMQEREREQLYRDREREREMVGREAGMMRAPERERERDMMMRDRERERDSQRHRSELRDRDYRDQQQQQQQHREREMEYSRERMRVAALADYERDRERERERDHIHHARERDYFAAQAVHAAGPPGARSRMERDRDPRDRDGRIVSDLERERDRELIERERDGGLRRDSLRPLDPGRPGPTYNGSSTPVHGQVPPPPQPPSQQPPSGMHPPQGIHPHPSLVPPVAMYPPVAPPPVGPAGSALPGPVGRPPPSDAPSHPYAMPHPPGGAHSASSAPAHYPPHGIPTGPPSATAPSGAMPPPPGAMVDPLRSDRERERREREHMAAVAAEHRERDRIERDRERERNLHLQQQDPRAHRERENPRERERTAGLAVTPLVPNAAARAGSVALSLSGVNSGARVGATTPAPNAGSTTVNTTPHQHHHHHVLRSGAAVAGQASGRATPGSGVSPRMQAVPLLPSGALSNGSATMVGQSISGGPLPPVPSVHAIQAAIVKGTEAPMQALAQANEQTWLLIGAVSEQLNDTDRANAAYEHALRHNPMSVSALTQVAGMARVKEDFHKAVDYYQRVLNISQENGEVWGSLGHCYLMMDDLQKAYTAYQQALYRLPNPKDPKLWYGIGILYDRYGSLEHAEEAFSSVLRMEPNFDKANEVYFRLGIIYKTQQKFNASLECFRYILNNPPKPLTEVDIWFQVGHVHEQQKDYNAAKDAYERVLKDNPNHAKVLQQLGWLYHQPSASFSNQDTAISYLTKSLEADPADAQSWYLLGRAFMEGQKYNKAYEAYQQAVYRDGKNPTFWCSIGVLYYQINQYRDALDAYSRAIRLNPFISEVWFNLGSLYESCNNQVNDAIDAYARAHDLDPANNLIKSRLNMLRNAERDGLTLTDPPPPQDVHPTAYAQTVANRAFPGSQSGSGSAPAPFESAPGPAPVDDAQPIVNGRDLAAPPASAQQSAAATESAFRNGGGPPPLQITPDVRGTAPRPAATLAPMDIEQRDRSAAPNRPAEPSLSGRSAAGEDDERTRVERTPALPHDYQGRRETPYRPGSSSSAVRSDEWHREKADRVVGNLHASPRVSPTATRVQANYASRAVLDPRLETSPRSVRHSPAYDYTGRQGSTGLRHAESATPQRGNDRLATRELEGGARATSIGRYPESAYEAERRRLDERKRRDWQEQDRMREEEDIRTVSTSAPLRVDQAKISSRAPSPNRPASSQSRPGSSRRKRKAKTAATIEQKEETEPDLGKTSATAATKTLTVASVSPRPAPVMDEDYDEGAADALMGLAGYRGTGQGKESTYAPVQSNIGAGVVRLDPHQITSNIMDISPQSLKRATTSSPPADNAESREKKARYASPARESAPASIAVSSPARTAPSTISIPSRTVTTMIEVLNPTRVTPTTNSPMTATEMVSPPQRVQHEDDTSPSRTSTTSPAVVQATQKGEQPGEETQKDRKDDVAEPPAAPGTPSATPVTREESGGKAASQPPASPEKKQASPMPVASNVPVAGDSLVETETTKPKQVSREGQQDEKSELVVKENSEEKDKEIADSPLVGHGDQASESTTQVAGEAMDASS